MLDKKLCKEKLRSSPKNRTGLKSPLLRDGLTVHAWVDTLATKPYRADCKMATSLTARRASNLLQRSVHCRFVTPNFIFGVCRNCSTTTVEIKNGNTSVETAPKMQEDEEKRKRRDEGKKLHAIYHMKVDKIAAEFLMKRQEEEMNLNQEMLKKKELQKLEKEMHDRIIESVHLENERVKQLR